MIYIVISLYFLLPLPNILLVLYVFYLVQSRMLKRLKHSATLVGSLTGPPEWAEAEIIIEGCSRAVPE
ncbi:uncharacterized protein BO88DRAFT_144547 [Aspergillus vadensis CBS 113365]|uniref:Uncharacterized protein n=1 Tax=Aspergillus vadensis (strain CBS 113365 / IMI 142717 / IBT 24658) TaxID=1448311 RepID=A0A319AZC6_ASPVC|nr:hypothetical protein BO88DRAFT_144547 [Aspergillus vadensis CBS 113365]PYH65175.1 hypothetical protein BO88DRAFT_144547 [Aspergillus vadensis CBS 113365]